MYSASKERYLDVSAWLAAMATGGAPLCGVHTLGVEIITDTTSQVECTKEALDIACLICCS